ncbi:hypothetical protein A9Q99_15660 [Gammaproteobacteria bacterium 45_16_T64]|nr:hypothetical protein A9Q99_15660 [Gammaproteobacteria bacterium 45_16_T64]
MKIQQRSSHLMRLPTLLLLLSHSFISSAFADDNTQTQNSAQDTVVVTGTYLPVRQSDIASPVEVIDRETIESSGAPTLNDFIKNIESNVGAEFNADVFSQGTSGGTSQINLRGLGLSSTLVLLNGRRTTLSGAYANDGSTYVDINTVPMIALDRVDVVKDGASALYGSDAVAGVVDFITRDDFEGIEFSTGYQETTDGNQSDTDFSLLWGWHGDKLKTLIALAYFERTPMAATERDFTEGTATNTAGFPASFIPLGAIDPASPYFALNGLAPAGTPIRDAGCVAGGGIIAEGANPFFGTCDSDSIPFFELVSEEDRQQGLVTIDFELNQHWNIFGEALYSKTEQSQTSSPSLPNLSFPVVPADNIGNLPINGGFGVPVVFIGTTLSNDSPPSINERISETARALIGVQHQINEHWRWESAYQYSYNNYYLGGPDTLTDRFNAALNGNGGSNNNEYFNPFSSALTVSDLGNSQAVIDDFTSISYRRIRTELQTWDAVVIGPLFDLPSGSIESAFGVQYRNETNRQELDENSNAFNYDFVVGASDSSDSRDVYAVFSELMIPVTDNLNIQLAGRFEEYSQNKENSFDPKLGIRWNATPTWSFRSSVSTAFRAPSLHQTSTYSIAIDQIGGSFVPVVTEGNADLTPEKAFISNLGVVFEPTNNLRASLDYWRYEYKDIIIKESAEGIFAANPNDPKIVYDATTGGISQLNLDFINASSVITDGIDLTFKYMMPTEYGSFKITNNTAYIHRYNLQVEEDDATIHAVGSRNFLNIARPLPRWRSSLGLSWLYGQHGFSTTTRYTHSYRNDEIDENNPSDDSDIDSHLTQDVQYNYSIPINDEFESQVTLGVINLFDQDPPEVSTNFGYDSKLHDPRGRLVYGRVTLRY